MKKFGLLGKTLTYSRSPILHSTIMKMMKREGEYHLFSVQENEVARVIEKLRRGDLQGLNVTIPYKEKVIEYLDELTPQAKAIGAVNTLYLKDNKVIGDNTDYVGFKKTLESFSLDYSQENALVLGSGGASKAIVKALLDKGVKKITIASRDIERAKKGWNLALEVSWCSYEQIPKEHSLLVNTTPCGMKGYELAIPLTEEQIKYFSTVIDIIYIPYHTPLLTRLKKGQKGCNGLKMLVYQAIEAEKIWWSCDCEVEEQIYETIKEIYQE